MKKVTVLLADDNPDMLCIIQEMLSPSCDVIAIAHDGASLVSAASKHRPDLIITDISMPGLSGIDASIEILRQQPGAKIILLTVNRDRVLVEAALAAGVLGYVLKMSAGEDLLSAIVEIRKGRRFVSPVLSARELKDSPSELYLSMDRPSHSSRSATKV